MNGAESLVRSLISSGVDTCFTNPGTSEMHFVAALDHVPGMRSILALFEGVATGAADGYYRMSRTPACTLLHLGPGLANGISNLHNAKKAGSGVVNIVGEHAESHRLLDAPLTSDIAGLASPVSHWVHSSDSAATVGRDGADAGEADDAHAPDQLAAVLGLRREECLVLVRTDRVAAQVRLHAEEALAVERDVAEGEAPRGA